jgi:hypothetical protein
VFAQTGERNNHFIGGDVMDTTMIVRIAAAVLVIVILFVLIQRRRTRVK